MESTNEPVIELGTASVVTQGNAGAPIEVAGLLQSEGLCDD